LQCVPRRGRQRHGNTETREHSMVSDDSSGETPDAPASYRRKVWRVNTARVVRRRGLEQQAGVVLRTAVKSVEGLTVR
jgi:hypothetical protein